MHPKSESIVIPGERISSVAEASPSHGTFSFHDHVYASLLGKSTLSASTDSETKTSTDKNLPSISVIHSRRKRAIPTVNSIVIGKILRISPRQAVMSIMAVGVVPTREQFQGIIRVQDVRQTEKDKVVMYKCYRPGDIVKAQVISLGDAQNYYLSTAKNELGVVFAQSSAGATLIPLSWETMLCPKTKLVEYRKCAKPMTNDDGDDAMDTEDS